MVVLSPELNGMAREEANYQLYNSMRGKLKTVEFLIHKFVQNCGNIIVRKIQRN